MLQLLQHILQKYAQNLAHTLVILLLRTRALNILTDCCLPLHGIPQARCYVLIFRSNCTVLKMSSTNGQAMHNPTYLN